MLLVWSGLVGVQDDKFKLQQPGGQEGRWWGVGW